MKMVMMKCASSGVEICMNFTSDGDRASNALVGMDRKRDTFYHHVLYIGTCDISSDIKVILSYCNRQRQTLIYP